MQSALYYTKSVRLSVRPSHAGRPTESPCMRDVVTSNHVKKFSQIRSAVAEEMRPKHTAIQQT